MVKFAHISDVHLGGWRQQPMQDLNFEAFRKTIDFCINEGVNFVLIAGDLFDSAYPSIEILKSTFYEFKRLKEARIPCFIIPGSHDYSVSGKSFLDVLEKAGFSVNIANFEERDGKIFLNSTIFENIALYGYPGKKAGLEVPDLRKIALNDSPGMFKILALHTTLDKAKGNLPIDAIEADSLPKVDYYALGHLHIDFQYKNFIYSGPLFPNNFQELEDLGEGSFYLVDINNSLIKRIPIKIKEIVSISYHVKDTINSTEAIISELKKRDLKDKIILVRLRGELEYKKISDIKFSEIENFVKERGAYFILKNSHELKTKEPELEVEVENSEGLEGEIINRFNEENASEFNAMIPQLIFALSIEKQEGETQESFSIRVVEESKKILKF